MMRPDAVTERVAELYNSMGLDSLKILHLPDPQLLEAVRRIQSGTDIPGIFSPGGIEEFRQRAVELIDFLASNGIQ